MAWNHRWLPALCLFAGCTTTSTPDAGSKTDASIPDAAGPVDSGTSDAAVSDASVVRPTLIINELMAANTTTLADEHGEFDDWLELYNPGPSDVNLQGCAISDDPVQPQRHVFASLTVPAGGYVVIFADDGPGQGPAHLPFKLSSSGETVTLRWTNGTTLDEVTYGLQETDVSVGRFPNGSGALTRMTIPTPGAANTSDQRDAGPGPDAAVTTDAGSVDANIPAATGVVINELLATNLTGLRDEANELDDWIELYNTSAEVKDLSFHSLSDTPALPLIWTFPAGSTIAGNGYLLVFADNQPEQGSLHAGFKLSSAGESVVLTAPNGTVLDTVSFGPQSADVSEGRLPDGTGTFRAIAPPTPNASNAPIIPDAGELPDAAAPPDAG